MFEYLLKLLTPKAPDGSIAPIIGYYLQNNKKTLAFVSRYAIKSQVFGLEVVVGETRRTKETNGGNQHLNHYLTCVYLTQHSGTTSTIEEAIDLLYDCDEFFDQDVDWPNTPQSTANVRRAVVCLNHRCLCPEWRE